MLNIYPYKNKANTFFFFHTISLSATKEPEVIKLVYSCKTPQIYHLNL